jgi:hypothetical protein
VEAVAGVQEELMAHSRPFAQLNRYREIKTQGAEWPAKRGDYVTLLMASLAISTVITLFIIPQLHQSPFF